MTDAIVLQASFSMTSNRSDIDINDPNFWQKWAKKADIDVDELKSRVCIFYTTCISLYAKFAFVRQYVHLKD